jgi:tetratricopeptide (TPR) repeat protein
MAEEQQVEYQEFMEVGNVAAWDQDWTSAIDAYTKAIQIMPDDPDAHVNLGLALLNAGQIERALKVYRRAHQLSPEDPLPLERSADILERLGQLREAAQQYVKVSEVYLSLRDLNKAIASWERATQLTPGLVGVHARLAQAYERVGDSKQAVREYLTLAFNFHRLGDKQKAIRAVDRALRLDRKNRHALNTLQALKADAEVVLPDEIIRRAPAKADDVIIDDSIDLDGDVIIEADPLGPIGEALNLSLELLAAYVVESGLDASVAFALQGMEAQRQSLTEEAIAGYLQADEAGMRHPAMKMALGGLLQLNDQSEEALKHLGEATVDSQLNAGALHAIGLAHYKLGDHKKASRYLIRSLQAVDTSLADNQEEIDELTIVYDNLLAALDGRTPDALSVINERFIGLLSGKDWKHRIAETRRHLDETLRDEGGQGVVDFLVAKGGDELAESVSRIDRFIRQGLYTLAMDECHRALERSPHYLPIHVRTAEIMMKEGRIRQAINKYNIVARSYLVRQEHERAASILQEVLEMAPLDVEVRTNLIELLESQDRQSEALDQYIDLAATYQQLGDFDNATQTFSAAERLATRIEVDNSKIIEIKHHIADLNQMRLNTRQAQRVYEAIIELDAQDEKALRGLVDIYFNQNNQVEAVKRLDSLLSLYAKKGMVNRITQMLEEFVQQYPSDTALRSRLASFYKRLGRVQEAIEQLDALGELQLDAGLNKDAANTIRQIITLKPDRIDEYKKLLSQLGG